MKPSQNHRIESKRNNPGAKSLNLESKSPISKFDLKCFVWDKSTGSVSKKLEKRGKSVSNPRRRSRRERKGSQPRRNDFSQIRRSRFDSEKRSLLFKNLPKNDYSLKIPKHMMESQELRFEKNKFSSSKPSKNLFEMRLDGHLSGSSDEVFKMGFDGLNRDKEENRVKSQPSSGPKDMVISSAQKPRLASKNKRPKIISDKIKTESIDVVLSDLSNFGQTEFSEEDILIKRRNIEKGYMLRLNTSFGKLSLNSCLMELDITRGFRVFKPKEMNLNVEIWGSKKVEDDLEIGQTREGLELEELPKIPNDSVPLEILDRQPGRIMVEKEETFGHQSIDNAPMKRDKNRQMPALENSREDYNFDISEAIQEESPPAILDIRPTPKQRLDYTNIQQILPSQAPHFGQSTGSFLNIQKEMTPNQYPAKKRTVRRMETDFFADLINQQPNIPEIQREPLKKIKRSKKKNKSISRLLEDYEKNKKSYLVLSPMKRRKGSAKIVNPLNEPVKRRRQRRRRKKIVPTNIEFQIGQARPVNSESERLMNDLFKKGDLGERKVCKSDNEILGRQDLDFFRGKSIGSISHSNNIFPKDLMSERVSFQKFISKSKYLC